ncbi:replication-relaxation family protein [Patulibacter sp. NPDC049589]|uniref:replication-relaxation family protein n=1 Tax=Patulibacter sp. NPDC049589 TaxID=3154731 RepID=UPI00343EFA3A
MSAPNAERGVRRLAPVAVAMLEGLYQHRLLTVRQLQDLYTPGRSIQWTQHLVRRLEHAGLVAATRQPRGRKILYLTPAGLDAVEAVPTTEPRRKAITAEHAAGPLQRHTLAVNDVGIAFVRAARDRGDEFGPLAWRHEVAHPIGPPPGRRRGEQLIADALLSYQQQDPDGAVRFHYRFLELDRATMPTDALATKLARYARLYHHALPASPGDQPVPGWETRYPVFPTVLLVLAGDTTAALERRRRVVLSLCAEDAQLQRTPEVEITAGLLQQLQTEGPFAAIWRTTTEPETAVDWLGNPHSRDGGALR